MPKAPRADTHAEDWTPPSRESMVVTPADVGKLEDVLGAPEAPSPPNVDQPPPPNPPPPPSATHTPDEWARTKGFFTPAPNPFRQDNYDWRHAAADAAHGWSVHAYHAGVPMQLSEADYDGAIAAVQSVSMAPHAPAISPHSPYRQGA